MSCHMCIGISDCGSSSSSGSSGGGDDGSSSSTSSILSGNTLLDNALISAEATSLAVYI
jgi:hypothetical protein